MTRQADLPAPLNEGLRAAVAKLAALSGSVTDLTGVCLERIGDLDPLLGCMTYLDVEGALVRAAELDQLPALERTRLPLFGIPIIVKEIYTVEGMPNSAATRVPVDDLFEPEGHFVRRLREAGCVLLGKSVSTEFALAHYNPGRAMPLNPATENPARVTGGSSSGSAAALAAGYCGFTVGTDTGGSVRAPAAFCGLTGFKPAAGYWPTDGIFPLCRRFDSPGLFTRSVDDLVVVLEALDSAASDGNSMGAELIGVPAAFFTDDLDEVVAAAWAEARVKLTAAGFTLVPLDFPAMHAVEDFFATEVPLELLATLGRNRTEAHLDAMEALTARRLKSVFGTLQDPLQSECLAELARHCYASMRASGVRYWLAPTTPCIAAPRDTLQELERLAVWQSRASRNTRCINALGMAAISLPASSAPPVGLQLACAPGDEAGLLKTARLLEAALSKT